MRRLDLFYPVARLDEREVPRIHANGLGSRMKPKLSRGSWLRPHGPIQAALFPVARPPFVSWHTVSVAADGHSHGALSC